MGPTIQEVTAVTIGAGRDAMKAAYLKLMENHNGTNKAAGEEEDQLGMTANALLDATKEYW